MTRTLIRATNTFGELLVMYGLILALATVCAAGAEGWTLGQAAWWAVVTATTTGYGDLSPATPAGRVIAAMLMHAAVLFILPLIIGRIIATLIENPNQFTDDEQRQMLADLAALRAAAEPSVWVVRAPHGGYLTWDSLSAVFVEQPADATRFADRASATAVAGFLGSDLTAERIIDGAGE